jgi:DNA-binding NarL/FixJ family response regulator
MEPVAIEGLRSLLQSVDGLRVVVDEITLADGLDAVKERQPALVVVDKAFGMQPLTDFLKIVRHATGSRVIVWSTMFSESEALRLLQAGAAGVVRKTSPLSVLLECLSRVAAGAQWMGDDIIRESGMGRPRSSTLTTREIEVMRLVELGLRNREIAESLGICVGTVKIHIKHIFEKTGMRGRYGLALSGLREKGLLTTLPM